MSSSLVKCPNIRYILIIRVEDIGKVSVVHQFITTIKNSHHWYSFPIQYLLYLKNLGAVIVLTKKIIPGGPTIWRMVSQSTEGCIDWW